MASVEKFTALVLVTGESNVEIESQILATLAPFTIKMLDKQSMDIRGRYFLALLFTLDPAHARAIEKDLLLTSENLNVDLAIDFRDYPVEL